jgi:2-C-methyl-D-erythritol 2,4-cyclodiphosphate synthase
VASLVQVQGYGVGNVDATVVAQVPRLAPFVGEMRRRIATDLGCAIDQVSVKATTTEGLGFTGRGEGIAALAAVVLIPTRQET